MKPKYEVYWIDQDGQAMRSIEKDKRMVVGKVKMLLDNGLAHPRNGIMIEIGVKGVPDAPKYVPDEDGLKVFFESNRIRKEDDENPNPAAKEAVKK